MLKTRILLGLCLLGGVTGVLYFDHATGRAWGAVAILVVGAMGGMFEYARLSSREDLRLPAAGLALFGGALVLLASLLHPREGEPLVAGFAAAVVILLAEGVFRGQPARSEAAALSIAGLVYVAFLTWFVVRVRFIDARFGEAAFYWFLAVNKGTDIGAFFTGKSIGRHKLCPNVSPGKTWEGSFGGTILGCGIGMAVWSVSALRTAYPWWSILIAAIPVSISGQIGDLVESLFKRKAGKKDSSQMIPTFGGFLDLLDCLLLSAPFAYYALAYVPRA